MLKLKCQYFGYLVQRTDSLGMTLMLDKIEGRRRERLPTPVLWPGEFHGLYSLWDRKELDTTERLSLTHSLSQGYGFFSGHVWM